ncbi:MAG: tripartite tricarboxylate transporter substrate binding protein [Deltaproteobacteria bacterium]|nr:tripartite tricarboxylate transporter substrate binding protein [Deltaproteobacteria bacterium]
MRSMKKRYTFLLVAVIAVASIALFGGVAKAAWPTRPISFVIPAGAGGGADKYVRFLVGLNVKGHYVDQAIIPVNKAGGAGAVAMNYVLNQKGDGYTMMITLNSFITTPLFQSLPFTFRNFTPIYLLALDNFPLWVPKDSPFKTFEDFLTEARKRSLTVGGTGSKQEDEIVFRAIETIGKTKPFRYVPFKGGGSVAKALVGKHIEASVNQVSEAGPFFPEFVRPLVVFQDKRLDVKGLENVPTAKELGFDFSYNMMRAVFAPPGISKEAQDGMIELFRKISDDPAWVTFAAKFGLQRTSISGKALYKFCEKYEKLHKKIMKAQGWIK